MLPPLLKETLNYLKASLLVEAIKSKLVRLCVLRWTSQGIEDTKYIDVECWCN